MFVDPQTLSIQLSRSVSQIPLLHTKLVPPPSRPDLVARPRLLAQFDQAIGRKCTLIAAPAGFGKTTAISNWAAQHSAPVAWLALDATDNDPIRFWTYVMSALDVFHVGISEPALALLQSPQPPPIEETLSVLLNAMSMITEPIILVLDDYHVIDSAAIHRAMGFLLDHLLPHLHLVIASRRDPPLALGRERARGALIELRAADLRFTVAEASELLNNVLGLQLADPDILALATRTEGWIAGLQLVALALPSQPNIPQFIEMLRGSDRHLVDYLVEEVLLQQSLDLQTFLVQTSILERFCGSLCDTVTGRSDGQAMIERLEQLNLFIVPLDRSRQWYRYHQLFAEFLRARLQHEQRNTIPELHRRAATWYTEHGMEAEAISHALASDDQHLAAKLINQYADTIIRHGELTTIISWLTALPDTALQAYPRLYLVHAWSLMMSSQFDTAELHLNKAQLILGAQAAGESEQYSSLSGELMVLRGAVAMAHGDSAQARDLLAQADTKLRPDNTIRQSLVMLMFGFQSLAHGDVEGASRTFIEVVMAGLDSEITATMLAAIYGLGYMQILNGNLHEAGHIFEQALQMAHSSGKPLSPMTSLIYLGLSKVRREFNDLAAAYDMAMKSISLGKRWGNTRFVVEAYLVLARIQRAQGALDAAFATTQVAEVTLQQAQNHRWMRSSMHAERVRIWLAKGDTLLAKRWADLYRLKIAKADKHMPPLLFQRDLEELMLVRVLIYPRHQQPSTHALHEAQHFLEAFLQRAKQIRSQERVIEATLLLALVWQARGDQQRMFEHLGRALRLAEPSGYIRLFIDEGEPMLQALQRYAHAPETQHGAEAVAPAYLQELITAATGDTSPSSTINDKPVRKVNNIGHLSDRELDVLRLIVSGATTDEIAHALTIAPGTVKRHLHSIYSKLDVRNRVQVVERARALRLVP